MEEKEDCTKRWLAERLSGGGQCHSKPSTECSFQIPLKCSFCLRDPTRLRAGMAPISLGLTRPVSRNCMLTLGEGQEEILGTQKGSQVALVSLVGQAKAACWHYIPQG